MDDPRSRPICILGATGSIGASTLDVAGRLGVPVHAVTANSKVEELARCAVAAKARVAVIGEVARLDALRSALAGSGVRAEAGAEALCTAACAPEVGAVVTAIALLYEVDEGTRVGLTWNSQVNLDFKGPAHFSNLSPTVATALNT
ncbi:MAG: hypothetical protein J0M02_14170, partial [Planctomycetes bacterium]|nr:hypothetical protein [Planctomycetota bacterium]